MKLFTILVFSTLLSCAGTLAAKPPFERPPVVFFRNGDISGYVGHDVRVTLRTALEKTGDALKFDGQRSVCRFSIPWLYPDRPLSASYVVDLTLDRLPEKGGVIAGRPGFHNALAVRPDGRVTFSCFGRDGKTSRLLISRNPLIPGKRHRVAGTMDCSRDNHTAMKLYIDGALEAADTLPMPPRHYGRELFLGGIDADRDGNAKSPAACAVGNFYFHYKALTPSEICALPGATGKEAWPVMSPVAALDGTGTAKPVFSGNVRRQDGAWHFTGGSTAAWKPGNAPESVTVTAAVQLDALPERNGVIAGRPGFDNALGVTPDGRVFFNVWNAFRSDSLMIHSKTRLVPGRQYRVTGVAEGRGVETVAVLYVNGQEEARDSIAGPVFPYGGTFFAGGFPDGKGGVRSALDCRIYDCRIYGIALLPEEIAAIEQTTTTKDQHNQ